MEGWIRSPQEVMQRFRALQLAHCRARKQRQQLNERHAAAAEAAQRAVSQSLQPRRSYGRPSRRSPLFASRSLKESSLKDRSNSSASSLSPNAKKKPPVDSHVTAKPPSASLRSNSKKVLAEASSSFQGSALTATFSSPLICIQAAQTQTPAPRSSAATAGSAGKGPVSEEAEGEAKALLLPWVQKIHQQQQLTNATQQPSLEAPATQGGIPGAPEESALVGTALDETPENATAGPSSDGGAATAVSAALVNEASSGGAGNSGAPTAPAETEGGSDISAELLALLLEHDLQATVTASEKDRQLFRESRPPWLDKQLRAFQLLCSQQHNPQQRILLASHDSQNLAGAGVAAAAQGSKVGTGASLPPSTTPSPAAASPNSMGGLLSAPPSKLLAGAGEDPSSGAAVVSSSPASGPGAQNPRASVAADGKKARLLAGGEKLSPQQQQPHHHHHQQEPLSSAGLGPSTGGAESAATGSGRRSQSQRVGGPGNKSLFNKARSNRRRPSVQPSSGGKNVAASSVAGTNNKYATQLPIRSDSSSFLLCRDKASLARLAKAASGAGAHLGVETSAASPTATPLQHSPQNQTQQPETSLAARQKKERLATLLLSFFVRDVPEEERKLRDLQLNKHARGGGEVIR